MVVSSIARTKSLILALGACVLSSQASIAEPGRVPVTVTAKAQIATAARPAGFFTIAERVAALRAKGALTNTRTVVATSLPAATSSLVETASLSSTPQDQDAGPHQTDLKLRPSLSYFRPDTVLGAMALPIPGGDLARKWDAVMARWEADRLRIEQCKTEPCTHAGARKWLEIQDRAAERSGSDQLSFVHAAINRSIAYATDFQIFAEADYWASPMEVMERAGDCEDYAIAKYLMLRSLGVDAADMKLVAIFETFSGQYHAILSVRHEGEWVFLDNKRGTVTAAKDYTNTRPVATIDAVNGQSMLVSMVPQRSS